MSTQEEQLIELMLELKKTTPQQARSILTSTPQIAYALVALMVKMNAIDVQVLQKTLTTYSANIPPPAPPPTQPSAQLPPASAVPPHFSQYRTPTPQTHTPPHFNGPGHTPQPPNQAPYMAQGQQGQYAGPSGFGTPPPAAPQLNNVGLPDALSSIPEDQKILACPVAMIMRVIAMTPEQINMLPPPERAGIMQLYDSSASVASCLVIYFRLTLMPVTLRPSTDLSTRNLGPIFPHVSTSLCFPASSATLLPLLVAYNTRVALVDVIAIGFYFITRHQFFVVLSDTP
ncbi:hypothetical protein OG21DRAFT_1499360 [Imleria badia]|nr:hypothetical protein OG21DRAFT_1499360 [Imleria badia]